MNFWKTSKEDMEGGRGGNSILSSKSNKNQSFNKNQQQYISILSQQNFFYENEDSTSMEDNDSEDSSSLISSTFSSLKSKISKQANNLAGLTNKMNEVQTALQSWKQFAIFFGFGMLLILISFTFLPIVILVPAKFSALFSLGCLSILVSIGILKGPSKFIKALTQKDKIIYSGSYVFTLLGTLYFSIISKSYLFVIAFAILQTISLGFLIASNFPGGTQGMKYILNKLAQCFASICGSWFKPKQSSFLPI